MRSWELQPAHTVISCRASVYRICAFCHLPKRSHNFKPLTEAVALPHITGIHFLAGQRAQFTWALNQYNLAENAEKQIFYAQRIAKYVATAATNGFIVEQVTQGQLYPTAEVEQYLHEPSAETGPEISEIQALHAVEEAVDTSDVVRLGEGQSVVYAYGYRCAPDRLKIGMTTGDAVQRIVAQISTGTPDKPVLLLEIRTHDCNSHERAVHAVLEYRGAKAVGAGKEWFKSTRDEIIAIYNSVGSPAESNH